MLEKRITQDLLVGFDVCCAYVSGQVEAARQMDFLVDDEKTSAELKQYCNRSKLDIIKTLGK